MSVLIDTLTAVPLAVFLSLYFYFKPTLGPEIYVSFFGIWLLCYALDAKITITNAHLMHHEKNLLFPFLYYKFGPKLSPIIQYVFELVMILLVVFLFEGQLVLISVSVVALVFGLVHLFAYVLNVRTIKKLQKN